MSKKRHQRISDRAVPERKSANQRFIWKYALPTQQKFIGKVTEKAAQWPCGQSEQRGTAQRPPEFSCKLGISRRRWRGRIDRAGQAGRGNDVSNETHKIVTLDP